jgi:hypothetical protein
VPAAGTDRRVPWSRPRRELLILLLVAFCGLTPISLVTSQDASRTCLSRAFAAGRLTITHCIDGFVDRAEFGGKLYSDKAPGVSALAFPAVELTRLPAPSRWPKHHPLRVWLVRATTSGLAFLVLVFLLGRIGEGLVRGAGGVVAATFAVGTIAAGLAPALFDQLPAAALAFGAFVIAWRRRPFLAGVIAGLAVTTEYQAALVAVLLAAYVAADGIRDLVRYVLGGLVGGLPLVLYDYAAFGSPLHASYRYVANVYAPDQAAGFFGISAPHADSVERVLFGDRGLLVTSPVLALAFAGLAVLARRRPREAALCAAVTVAFLALEFGYFLPYGGISPGPRFFAPALPFLVLGLAEAWRRWRVTTLAAAAVSVIGSTVVALTWSSLVSVGYRETVWGELARGAAGAPSRLRGALTDNLLTSAGLPAGACAALVAAAALAALAVGADVRLKRRAR